jgi:hypothetical protein
MRDLQTANLIPLLLLLITESNAPVKSWLDNIPGNSKYCILNELQRVKLNRNMKDVAN